MAGRLGLTGQEVLAAFRELELPGWHENQRYLAGEDGGIVPHAAALADILTAKGMLTKASDIHGLVSNDYLPKQDR